MGYRYNPAIDKLMKDFSSLSPIAKSGKLEDSTGNLDISKGGTGGNNAETAKKNLGIKSAASFEANKKPGIELSEDDDSTLITVKQLYESGDKFKTKLGLGSSAYTNTYIKNDTASLRELPDSKDLLITTGSLRGLLIKAFGPLEGFGVYNTKSLSSLSEIPQSDTTLATSWSLRAASEYLNNKFKDLGDSSTKNIYNGRVSAGDLVDSDDKIMTTGSTKSAILKERNYVDSRLNNFVGNYNKLSNRPNFRGGAFQEVTISVSENDPYGYNWSKTDNFADSESYVWSSKKSYRALKGLYDSISDAKNYPVSKLDYVRSEDYKYPEELAKIGHVTAALDYLKNSWGSFKDVHIFDSADPEKLGWGMAKVPSEGALKAVWERRNEGAIVDMRWVKVFDGGMEKSHEYGDKNGEVISSIAITGEVDNNWDFIKVSILQVYQNGNWRTIYGTR